MSVNNKRQIALSVHILILYTIYVIVNKPFDNILIVAVFIYMFFWFLVLFGVMFLDKVLSFFFHNDGYTGEKTIVDENIDIVENMFLPKFLLHTIDFLTFGAARSFWNTFYYI